MVSLGRLQDPRPHTPLPHEPRACHLVRFSACRSLPRTHSGHSHATPHISNIMLLHLGAAVSQFIMCTSASRRYIEAAAGQWSRPIGLPPLQRLLDQLPAAHVQHVINLAAGVCIIMRGCTGPAASCPPAGSPAAPRAGGWGGAAHRRAWLRSLPPVPSRLHPGQRQHAQHMWECYPAQYLQPRAAHSCALAQQATKHLWRLRMS